MPGSSAATPTTRGVLDDALADGRGWILGGEAPSVADFSLCGYLVHAGEAKVDVPATIVNAWLDRLRALPAWRHPYDMLA